MKQFANHSVLIGSALCLVSLAQVACGPSLYRKKPADPTVNRAVTELWQSDIEGVAQTGDWILTRSYSAIGDVIVLGTGGEEISHAAIYDAERGTVIEAITPTVREVPLASLLDRNRVAIVVRPHGTTEASRRASVARARSVVGNKFDYTGLMGVGDDDKFYCSELVVWASGVLDGERIISPSSLIKRGEIVYLSGLRENAVVQKAAVAHSETRSDRVVRTAANTQR